MTVQKKCGGGCGTSIPVLLDACADCTIRTLRARVAELEHQRDTAVRALRELLCQMINSHGRDKIICIVCDRVSSDQVQDEERLHEEECEVLDARRALADIEKGDADE